MAASERLLTRVPTAEGEVRWAGPGAPSITCTQAKGQTGTEGFDSWAEVVGFLASAHAQGRGTPSLCPDWPKMKYMNINRYEYYSGQVRRR